MAIYRGSCHCGAVEFECDTELDRLVTCTCSMCSRRAAPMLGMPEDKLRIVNGRDSLTLYQFGTHTAEHYFCKTCGIYTHHRTRSDPGRFTVNARCLDGVDVDAVPVVSFDGRTAF